MPNEILCPSQGGRASRIGRTTVLGKEDECPAQGEFFYNSIDNFDVWHTICYTSYCGNAIAYSSSYFMKYKLLFITCCMLSACECRWSTKPTPSQERSDSSSLAWNIAKDEDWYKIKISDKDTAAYLDTLDLSRYAIMPVIIDKKTFSEGDTLIDGILYYKRNSRYEY